MLFILTINPIPFLAIFCVLHGIFVNLQIYLYALCPWCLMEGKPCPKTSRAFWFFIHGQKYCQWPPRQYNHAHGLQPFSDLLYPTGGCFAYKVAAARYRIYRGHCPGWIRRRITLAILFYHTRKLIIGNFGTTLDLLIWNCLAIHNCLSLCTNLYKKRKPDKKY